MKNDDNPVMDEKQKEGAAQSDEDIHFFNPWEEKFKDDLKFEDKEFEF